MDEPSPVTDLQDQPEAPADPESGRWAGRRLADAVNEVFQLALYRGDLRTAAELFSVMERVCKRSQAALRYDNRPTDPLIELARRELQARIAKARR